MDKETLEYFRRLLTKKLNDLLEEAEKTVVSMAGNGEETFPDPTDRASLETDRNFLLRIRDRERKLIGKIRDAIKRIDNGSFGICEGCGEEISRERLEVRPVTVYCIECKKKEEEMEKVRGL